jgi:hypothetical protein
MLWARDRTALPVRRGGSGCDAIDAAFRGRRLWRDAMPVGAAADAEVALLNLVSAGGKSMI